MKSDYRKTAKCKECDKAIYPWNKNKICWDCHIKKVKKYYGEPIRKSLNVKKKEYCEKCGSKEGLEKHHPNYSKPLEIVTLCKCCHMEEHGR
jgi:hypothetical protein